MFIKVCGFKNVENAKAIEAIERVSLFGHIFYGQSKRYVGDENPGFAPLDSPQSRVGVFVNSPIEYIKKMVKEYHLKYIQLHGNESPEDCEHLSHECGLVMKAISIENKEDLKKAIPFEGKTNFLLFDTKTPLYGGSGRKFDWSILNDYEGKTPFFLSGGIQPEDAQLITSICHPKWVGIDINSGFEDKPGIKNFEKIKKFVDQLEEYL